MKKFIIFLLFTLIVLPSCAQTTPSDPARATDPTPTYRLFPTQNMWTFIKLNTSNGLMWRVQYSTKGEEYRFEEPISASIEILKTITEKSETQGEAPQFYPGRFTLLSTQNMYNFLLLDQLKGHIWQVQYPRDSEEIILISK